MPDNPTVLPYNKKSKHPKNSLDFGSSWDSIIELPLVKREFLADLVRNEVAKGYPRSIAADKPVFWTVLASQKRNDAQVLICLASVPFGNEVDAIPALHVAVRSLLKSYKGEHNWQVVLTANSQCQILAYDGNVASLNFYPETSLIDRLEQSQTISRIVILIPQNAEAELRPRVGRFNNVQLLISDALNLETLSGLGSWPAKPKNKNMALIIPLGLILCLLGILLFRTLIDQDKILANQKMQIQALQGSLGSFQKISQEIKAIEEKLAGIPLPKTMGIYKILDTVALNFPTSDRTISIRYDGKSRSLSMVCLSQDPIKLLKRLTESEFLDNIASSGMVPWAPDPGFQKFQWSGVIRK